MTGEARMERERASLRDLSARLLRLHSVLLDRARYAYEIRHGSVAPRDLLPLLIHDEHFAWLRPLSGMIAGIDEVVDTADEIAARDVERLFAQVQRLLRSDDSDPTFHTSYRDALQESPDVVMRHADVVKLLVVSLGPPPSSQAEGGQT
jgi:hypothetical protein